MWSKHEKLLSSEKTENKISSDGQTFRICSYYAMQVADMCIYKHHVNFDYGDIEFLKSNSGLYRKQVTEKTNKNQL